MRLWRKSNTVNGAVVLSRLIEGRPGWYDAEEFCEILKRERNRSNRTGLPISFVNIMLAKSDPSGNAAIARGEFLEGMVDRISDHTRDFDICYLKDDSQLGVLLVDTPLEGAKAFIEKLSRVLYQHFSDMKRSDFLKTIQSITISSYPMENLSEPGGLTRAQLNGRHEKRNGTAFKHQHNTSTDSTETAPYQSQSNQLQWDIVATPAGAAAIDLPIFYDLISEEEKQVFYHIAKRAIDIVGALFGILLFLPIMALIAFIVKATSRGPILFKQKRLGRYGHPFTFLKFRSMMANNDDSIHREYIRKLIEGTDEEVNQGSEDKPVFKLTSDPRITRVGRILRKTSLDEIPQFFNVLAGTMSLVGPRPSVFYEVETYKNWHMRRVLEAKPGITGLWQVYGRSKTTFDDMVRLDLRYVERQSILLDIKILLKTIPAILNVNSSGAM